MPTSGAERRRQYRRKRSLPECFGNVKRLCDSASVGKTDVPGSDAEAFDPGTAPTGGEPPPCAASEFADEPLSRHRLDGVGAFLTGTDADEAVDAGHPDLAVADLAGVRRRLDGRDDRVHAGIVDHQLQANLGHEVDLVLGSAVGLTVATLATEAAHLADGDALHTGGLEGVLHVVQFERLHDCCDEFHVECSSRFL